jgi:hypothetical protein
MKTQLELAYDSKNSYNQNKKEINQQIKMLKESLEKHSKNFKKDEKNWGFVGDLGMVKSKLSELDGFFQSLAIDKIQRKKHDKRICNIEYRNNVFL